MAKKAKIDYDTENDILRVYAGDKIEDSLEVDEFIIDFSHEGVVVGIEINNASEILTKLSQGKITKSNLSKLSEGIFSSVISKELVYVFISFQIMEDTGKEIPVRIPVPIPRAVTVSR